jgi:crotonobetainyl-CoA:carnitine CoA-transferase CaiB-like acyl-CoA transferase
MNRLPLSGHRIVDLTMVWAGPYATRFLADMGAEVIKVEAVDNWDLLRSLHLLPEGTERWYNRSAYFNHNNRNKLGCTINLSSNRGKELLMELVAMSDAVIENYRADVLDKLGLGYEVLRRAREDIILISMPGYGKSGPEKDYVSYGTNVEQLAGLVSLTGYSDRGPHKSGISYGDPVGGLHAAAALAMALQRRRETGLGAQIEVAQREALISMIGEFIVGKTIGAPLPVQIGNANAVYAPHGIYPCSGEDRWIAIAAEDDRAFAALSTAMEQDSLVSDPRFLTNRDRLTNRDELDSLIGVWTSSRDRDQIFHELQAAGVTAGPVFNVPDLVADRHLRERGFFEKVSQVDAGEWEMDGVPWKLSRTPAHIRRPAPNFGEHNDYVFRELLGLGDSDLEALKAEGVIGDEPNTSLNQ